MSSKAFHSKNAAKPVGHFPHAREAGGLLFLSGIGPRSSVDNSIPTTFEGQVLAVFKNVRHVLEESGSAWNRMVDVTVYLTDMKRDFAAYNRLWAEHFRDDPPCRTTVEVTALPTPIDIELKVIALPGRGHKAGRPTARKAR